jgi:hypothetical protein
MNLGIVEWLVILPVVVLVGAVVVRLTNALLRKL